MSEDLKKMDSAEMRKIVERENQARLQAFNQALNELQEDHGIVAVPVPIIVEGRIEARLQLRFMDK